MAGLILTNTDNLDPRQTQNLAKVNATVYYALIDIDVLFQALAALETSVL